MNSLVSKRAILKDLASVFDPLGFVSPVLLWGKVLLQELWSKGQHWDDELDANEIERWLHIKVSLADITDVLLPRCIAMKTERYITYNLTCFCDASAKAYATAIYLHQEMENHAKADLVFAKSRIAPIKQTTIPRLELMAVVIAVRCATFVKTQLHIPIQHS